MQSTTSRHTSAPSSAPSVAPRSPANAPLALDNQLCFALYSASLAMTKLYKPVLVPLGLTYPQYLTLLALWERDGQGVSELGERLYLDSGTLTPLLKRMEASGWLLRRRSTDDERRVMVYLTERGQALRSQARKVPHVLAGMTGISFDQIGQFTQRLQRLRTQLQLPLVSPVPAKDTP
ncbi:MAG: MarR family transcriptional regulator [Burkholderiaceae bacterium]